MASPDPTKAYLAGGRLAYGCSDLSAAYPHGGTALGLVGNVVLRPPSQHSVLIEEETNAASNVLFLGGTPILGCRVKGWDDDALGAIWPNTTTGANGKLIDFQGAEGIEPTYLTNLCFTAINSDYPAVVIPKCAALPEADARLSLSMYRYLEFAVVFVGVRDASDQWGQMGPITDITVGGL